MIFYKSYVFSIELYREAKENKGKVAFEGDR